MGIGAVNQVVACVPGMHNKALGSIPALLETVYVCVKQGKK